ENLLFTGQIDSSLKVLKQFLNADSTSAWTHKSIYVIAYIYEKKLQNADSAIYYYSLLSDKYSTTEYGKKAKLKIGKVSEVASKTKTKVKEKTKKEKDIKIVSSYSEADIERLRNKINNLLHLDYEDIAQKGQLKRFWSKKMLREFINQL
ncbi:MAG: hypothetical protein KAR38_14450, partial [Calditrichia bacterium]|nr:hypothetical protein [Calditrichia bacterium]